MISCSKMTEQRKDMKYFGVSYRQISTEYPDAPGSNCMKIFVSESKDQVKKHLEDLLIVLSSLQKVVLLVQD